MKAGSTVVQTQSSPGNQAKEELDPDGECNTAEHAGPIRVFGGIGRPVWRSLGHGERLVPSRRSRVTSGRGDVLGRGPRPSFLTSGTGGTSGLVLPNLGKSGRRDVRTPHGRARLEGQD